MNGFKATCVQKTFTELLKHHKEGLKYTLIFKTAKIPQKATHFFFAFMYSIWKRAMSLFFSVSSFSTSRIIAKSSRAVESIGRKLIEYLKTLFSQKKLAKLLDRINPIVAINTENMLAILKQLRRLGFYKNGYFERGYTEKIPRRSR